MLCGGVFAFNLQYEDLFVCSDGVEMTQKELMNISRGIISLLHQHPIQPNGRRVLFVEASTTLIKNSRGFILGVSTYHPQSIPLLSSFISRLYAAISVISPGNSEISLENYHFRSSLFRCIRNLLGSNSTVLSNFPRLMI